MLTCLHRLPSCAPPPAPFPFPSVPHIQLLEERDDGQELLEAMHEKRDARVIELLERRANDPQ